MTKRMYRENGGLRCLAQVVECRPVPGGYEILTDATAIFPESGGQLSDTGYMGEARISHAREEGEDVWHLADRPLEKGARVTVEADYEPRLDHTQQHTGEHILSGLASKLYGAKNVGFHMAEDYATIDLDIPLTGEQIRGLQLEANRAVQRNLPVTYKTVRSEELDNIPLRKRARGLTGDVRIVYIDDGRVDSCTCCGTHSDFTGQVGYIKITSFMKYKGGTRLWFACGMRAVEDSLKNQDIVGALALRFSTGSEGVESAVARLVDELAAMKRRLKERTEELYKYLCGELRESAEDVNGVKLTVYLRRGASMNELKVLAEKLAAWDDALAVLIGENGGSLIYQAARGRDVKLGMKALIKAVNAALGGKGGGRDDFAQGSAALAVPAGAERAAELIKSLCLEMLEE